MRRCATWLVVAILLVVGCKEPKKVLTLKGRSAEAWSQDLTAEKSSVRSEALLSISQICEKDPAEVPHLAKGLKDPAPDLRMTTIRFLSNLGAKATAAVPELLAMTANESEEQFLRDEAKKAVEAINPQALEAAVAAAAAAKEAEAAAKTATSDVPAKEAPAAATTLSETSSASEAAPAKKADAPK